MSDIDDLKARRQTGTAWEQLQNEAKISGLLERQLAEAQSVNMTLSHQLDVVIDEHNAQAPNLEEWAEEIAKVPVLKRQLAEAQAENKRLREALESIADAVADEEMDRLHREGTSWGRIYEERAREALKGAQ
jgi:hypothetical protein